MSTISLVSKYLEADKVHEIALELAHKVGTDQESLDTLYELFDIVNESTLDQVTDIITPYIDNIIDSIHSQKDIDSVTALFEKLPKLSTYTINKFYAKLSAFVGASLHKFIPSIKTSLADSGLIVGSQILEIDYVVYLLRFLECICAKSDYDTDPKVDKLICYLLAFDLEEVYSQVLKIIKWRIVSITNSTKGSNFLWNIIFKLVASENRTHQTNGFIVWLRYLNNENSTFEDDEFFQKKVLQGPEYFQFLQDGLISELHEHRKLCISILKLSILKINSEISTSIFSWELLNREKHMKEWERFITVFEIIAIDTSLHQAEAASSDIILLISPISLIHPSWGFRLLSTGFRAGTDQVRKFTLNLLLSVPSSYLYLIKYALPILEDIFLPYMMMANHLIVIEGECPYGNLLSDFLSDMIKSCETESDMQLITNSIFNVLVKAKEAFDPSKIVVLRGIYNGLRGKRILSFGSTSDNLISLFETSSEGLLYHKTLQTFTLAILLNFRFENVSFLKTIDKFIKFNGSRLINEQASLIKAYLIENNADFHCEMDDDFTVALALYFRSLLSGELEVPNTTVCFSNLIGSGLDLGQFNKDKATSACIGFLDELVETSQSTETYEVLAKVDSYSFNTEANLSKLWVSVQEDTKLQSEQVLRGLVDKYKFLNNLINKKNISLFTTKELLDFKKSIFINSRSAIIQAKDFYKVKEDVLGQFYRTVKLMTEYGYLDIACLDDILFEVSTNLANYQSNISITVFLSHFLTMDITEKQVEEILNLLLGVWTNLTSTRLQLHQKELHKLLIKGIMNPKILKLAYSSDELAESLIVFTDSIVENSVGRRGLLPVFAASLANYHVIFQETFEKSDFLCEILVKCFTVYQSKINAFKLELVIAKVYDKTFNNEHDLYLEIYDVHEISSVVHMLAIFNSISSAEFARTLIKYIVDNAEPFNLFKVIKSADSHEQWLRIKLFSIILSVINLINSDLEQYLQAFIPLLKTDPSPLVRVFLEWIISLKLTTFPDIQEQIFQHLKELMNSKDLKPTLVCSYQRLLVLFINNLPSGQREESLEKLLRIVIPSATSNKAMIRHFSTSLICSLFRIIQLENLKISTHLVEILREIDSTANANINLEEYRNGDALLWNITKDLSLVNISGVILMRVSNHDVEFVSASNFRKYLSPAQIANLNVPIGDDNNDLWVKNRKKLMNKATVVVNKPSLVSKTPLQTKSGAWSSVMDLDDTVRGGDIKRSDLIVVSSLVDKPPNLGGICRLCDVLGAGLLTLHDISVKSHPEFKNVAVTADRWMPMVEVPVDSITEYLRQKKKEGYTLIGLEQTDSSVELNSDLKFPKKSLILIGKEREGVPGDLLAELDFCVEIKQVGVIRSMNIQTATAIIVHAYSSQHC